MITTLAIKNYALIEDIRVEFKRGLTIITGETGAGKSILLGALGLVLGKRADSKVVRNTEKKCVIEAEFDVRKYQLELLFSENDLDFEPHTILRREILPSGKSRAFVNDTPVTLQQMQLLGERLIDVHAQNDKHTLTTESFQIDVIDALAGNQELRVEYSAQRNDYKRKVDELDRLRMEKEQAAKELDYHNFLYSELNEANLSTLDQPLLEEAYEKLNNVEEIQEALSQVAQLLQEETSGTLATATNARTLLNSIRDFSKQYGSFWERLNSVIIELADLNEEIVNATEQLEPDPRLLAEVNEKLQRLQALQQKHAVASVKELMTIEEELGEKIERSSNIETHIDALVHEAEVAKERTSELAIRLNEKRRKAIPTLKQKLENILQELGLPNAQFRFELDDTGEFRKHGNAVLELLFTANKGAQLAPLGKVASGGEMSRIMLAVKAVLAEYKQLPTLIFDEIDSGISGEIGHKMAEIMSAMSEHMQLLSITHLPQIAAKGDNHKRVFKVDREEVTQTMIKDLNEEERVIEIAQMIGGSSVSDSAIAHAKQLLN
ncbi:MAG: DNA repair protein RecN [Flavobacteriaceae bacterium]|nr:DNA repair protein RecN [Flavobacteriaceae bacterium]